MQLIVKKFFGRIISYIYSLLIVRNNYCGSIYNQTDTAKTNDSAPLEPKERDVIIANATSVRLLLLNWPNGDCPIEYYTVEYRRKVGTEPWNLVTSHAIDNIIIRDLKPATWYSLRLTANNDAGSTQALMDFATTTLGGVSIGPLNDLVIDEDALRSSSSYKVLYVVIPLICAIVLIVSAVVVGYVMLKRNGRSVLCRSRLTP